jgi:hypothetical protein
LATKAKGERVARRFCVSMFTLAGLAKAKRLGTIDCKQPVILSSGCFGLDAGFAEEVAEVRVCPMVEFDQRPDCDHDFIESGEGPGAFRL